MRLMIWNRALPLLEEKTEFDGGRCWKRLLEVVDTQEFATLRDSLPQIIKNFGKLDKKVTPAPERVFGKKRKKKRFNFL